MHVNVPDPVAGRYTDRHGAACRASRAGEVHGRWNHGHTARIVVCASNRRCRRTATAIRHPRNRTNDGVGRRDLHLVAARPVRIGHGRLLCKTKNPGDLFRRLDHPPLTNGTPPDRHRQDQQDAQQADHHGYLHEGVAASAKNAGMSGSSHLPCPLQLQVDLLYPVKFPDCPGPQTGHLCLRSPPSRNTGPSQPALDLLRRMLVLCHGQHVARGLPRRR